MDYRVPTDTVAGAAIIASLLQWIPPVAAILGVVWYLIQIYESQTVRHYLDHLAARRLLTRKARLKRRIRELSSALQAVEPLAADPAPEHSDAAPAHSPTTSAHTSLPVGPLLEDLAPLD